MPIPTFYSKKSIQHFNNPKNYGKMKNPDGIGKAGNIICGDVMWLYIKVGKNDVIKDITFQTYGCLAAIASSSMITEMVKGKTIQKALDIDRKKIVKNLGGLPAIKIHCSVLAADALYEAIFNYLSKNKREIPKELLVKHQQLKKEEKQLEKRYKK
ncbi:MAG: iron-sulfur cluster assembly scaffold protein [Candidatus Paceibacterota bacterium]|jgi:nitrogen fixation NifU-like protein|nr:iron-sulfur cluster assembly scaffold protein [Candidatus Paceibacterota bacterium]